MTNPLSHKCENDSEPDQLIGDSDSKKHVNKYNLIPSEWKTSVNGLS